MNKKIMLILLMLITAFMFTGCKREAIIATSIGLRVERVNESAKYDETLYKLPVAEDCSISVIIKGKTNKQSQAVYRVEIIIEDEDGIAICEEEYHTGANIVKDSVDYTDENKKISFDISLSKETAEFSTKFIFSIKGHTAGKTKIYVNVYEKDGDEVISGQAEKRITFN